MKTGLVNQRNHRKWHRWLMLLVGLQCLVWSVTGVYMVFFDIDYIHGDTLVVNHQTKLDVDSVQVSVADLLQRFPDANDLELVPLIDRPVYVLSTHNNNVIETRVIDAVSGQQLSPFARDQAIAIARHWYSGSSEVQQVSLITNDPPFELASRHLPAWRVDFNAFTAPTLYVSATTGQLVGKRHGFWRLFDWMFRFHVMDYDDGENVQNNLLFFCALLALLASLTGAVLSYFSLLKKRPQLRGAK